ncbi:MAG: ammonium transporter [Leptolyngbyaceae cyanobacterium MO_188.B28]|nr:ammonium transporter [Leptolyngbyaceae cyanobacterium MO_188.B28]
MARKRRQGLIRSRKWRLGSGYFWLSLVLIVGFSGAGAAIAQEGAEAHVNHLHNIWMLISAALVFIMNAGFAMLEAGFCRRKNAVNILAKNLIVFCVATLAYWLFGFALMFGDSSNSLIGQSGFFFDMVFPSQNNLQPFPLGFSSLENSWPARSFSTLFLFQLVFAGITAAIVSGAVAERIKFWAFMLFSFVLVGLIYPLGGYWAWSANGWLRDALNFHDFAGSTVVHSVGGAAALAGAWLLKPREGRFNSPEDVNSFAPDNLGFATLGCLILWLGWFGFNGGSAHHLVNIPHVITTTMISAAAGGIAVLFWSGWFGHPKLGSIINGILGGLVGITASSAYVNAHSSLIIGAVSGFFVLIGEFLLERWKIDDPVGAIPVHLFCGFWGTLAVGLFAAPGVDPLMEYTYRHGPFQQTLNQFLGWLAIVGTAFLLSCVVWLMVGGFLHYTAELDRRLGGRIDPQGGDTVTVNFSLVKFLLAQIQTARNALRVSGDDETMGSDGFFY